MEPLKDNKGTPAKRTGTKDSVNLIKDHNTNLVDEVSDIAGQGTKVNELMDAGLKITKTE